MFDIGAGQHIASGRMTFTADAEEIVEYIRLVVDWPYTEKSMVKLKSNHPFFSDPHSKVLFRTSTSIPSIIPTHARDLTLLASGEWLFQFVAVSQATLETYELFLDWVRPHLTADSIETPLIRFTDLKRNFWGTKYKWHQVFISGTDMIVEKKYYPVEDDSWERPWNLYISNY